MDKNQNRKVSIFITAYNAEKTIEQCITSVLNQSLKFDQIIIVNDKSTDDTLNILKKFKDIKIINNTVNKGVSYSRNLGVKNCENEIIAGIDSDVELNKDWLKNILKKFLDSDAVYCCGNVVEKFTSNKFNYWRSLRYPLNWGSIDIKNPPYIITNNTLQYKKIWSDVGGFDENFKYPGGEDIIYSEKIYNKFKDKLFYFADISSTHLADDNIFSLSNRIWRYHSFGYKIKQPSLLRLIKLVIKQLKFLFIRITKDIIKLRIYFIYINIMVFILFIKYEWSYTFSKK